MWPDGVPRPPRAGLVGALDPGPPRALRPARTPSALHSGRPGRPGRPLPLRERPRARHLPPPPARRRCARREHRRWRVASRERGWHAPGPTRDHRRLAPLARPVALVRHALHGRARQQRLAATGELIARTSPGARADPPGTGAPPHCSGIRPARGRALRKPRPRVPVAAREWRPSSAARRAASRATRSAYALVDPRCFAR